MMLNALKSRVDDVMLCVTYIECWWAWRQLLRDLRKDVKGFESGDVIIDEYGNVEWNVR